MGLHTWLDLQTMSNCVVCGEVFLLWVVPKYFGGVTPTTLPPTVLPVVQAGLYRAYSPKYIGSLFRIHPFLPAAPKNSHLVCGIN